MINFSLHQYVDVLENGEGISKVCLHQYVNVLENGEGILLVCLHQYVEMPIVSRPDCQEDYSEVKS